MTAAATTIAVADDHPAMLAAVSENGDRALLSEALDVGAHGCAGLPIEIIVPAAAAAGFHPDGTSTFPDWAETPSADQANAAATPRS